MNNPNIDVTVATNIMQADGIGRQGIGILKTVYDSLNVNVYKVGPCVYKDVPYQILDIIKAPFNGFGKITFWTFILGLDSGWSQYHKEVTSPIKIAYSMFESDLIPGIWVDILNKYYDMVVVPDPYLVGVYKSSGVKIPIFIIPLGITIENLLSKPLKINVNDPFTFGMSAGFWGRKGHIDVLQAFAKRFGNDPKFKLRLHGRFGPYKNTVEKAIKDVALNNVELLTEALSPIDYDNFMNSIDCYTFVSGGEGFSITPREMLALGKPVILSNNTCHKTICDSGFVIPIAANNKVPAFYEVFNKSIGNHYKVNIDDLADVMKQVVDNYDQYLKQAEGGREWVKQYLWPNLKPQYMNLFKPKSIELGTNNHIDENTFITSNKKLFNKIKSEFHL
jgi:glycosyltransferase involved in cell wall biosynthesis